MKTELLAKAGCDQPVFLANWGVFSETDIRIWLWAPAEAPKTDSVWLQRLTTNPGDAVTSHPMGCSTFSYGPQLRRISVCLAVTETVAACARTNWCRKRTAGVVDPKNASAAPATSRLAIAYCA
ncbi:MAG: hypothetical protein WBO55_12305 [Rhizobiaceae bacterium]